MSSFEDRVSEVVQSILSDSTQLPAEFVSALPQLVAQNPVAEAPTGIIAYGIRTSAVSSAGTTFAGGADLLSSVLSFSSDGKSDYLVTVCSSGWSNSTASTTQWLRINLNGADAGSIVGVTGLAAGQQYSLNVAGQLTKPSAGSHTLNVRLMVSGGTGTVQGGSGGAGANLPILVALQRLAVGS